MVLINTRTRPSCLYRLLLTTINVYIICLHAYFSQNNRHFSDVGIR
nr:MAG TPA: hypothetical protein [Bacteriophage sp.]DAY35004.1 MAG TPA: hypothetical protein [Bacteriophage sp.]